MTLKYKKGDIIKAALDGEINVLIHQCNCFNNMGKGIAPKIAQAFPDARDVDSSTVNGSRDKLGTYTVSHANPVCSVVNLYGQYGWWKRKDGKINTEYEHLSSGLQSLGDRLRERLPNAKIGMPRIGCGLGGGDWAVVEEIINNTLCGLDVTVYLYEDK